MGFVCRIIGRTTMDKVSRALRGHAARPQSPLPDWVPAASVVHSCRFTTPQPRAPDLLPILAREAHQRRATLRRSIGYPTWRSSSASPDAAQCSRRPPDLVVRSAPRQTLANARPRRRSSLSPLSARRVACAVKCARRMALPAKRASVVLRLGLFGIRGRDHLTSCWYGDRKGQCRIKKPSMSARCRTQRQDVDEAARASKHQNIGLKVPRSSAFCMAQRPAPPCPVWATTT